MPAIVYFSSVSENTRRFMDKCDFPAHGLAVHRIPLHRLDPPLHVDDDYVLITPTYGGGRAGRLVPPQVVRFLNDEGNRSHMRGVIGSGNMNFFDYYAVAADVIARKCGVPVLYRFELVGADEDVRVIVDGCVRLLSKPGAMSKDD